MAKLNYHHVGSANYSHLGVEEKAVFFKNCKDKSGQQLVQYAKESLVKSRAETSEEGATLRCAFLSIECPRLTVFFRFAARL